MHWLRDLSLFSEIDPEPLDVSALPIASYTRVWPEDVAAVKPYLSRYRDSLRKLYFAFVRERRSKAKQRALFKHGFSVSKRDTPKLGFGWEDFKKFANLFKICQDCSLRSNFDPCSCTHSRHRIFFSSNSNSEKTIRTILISTFLSDRSNSL